MLKREHIYLITEWKCIYKVRELTACIATIRRRQLINKLIIVKMLTKNHAMATIKQSNNITEINNA